MEEQVFGVDVTFSRCQPPDYNENGSNDRLSNFWK